MDIRNNYLSTPNPNFPDNLLWDPNDPNHLEELRQFLPTPAGTVGIGFAVLEEAFDLTELPGEIPIRLSTFTTHTVSVDYSIHANGNLYHTGSIQFVPGETLKHIRFYLPPPLEDLRELRIELSNPAGAELTGPRRYTAPYESTEPLILEGDHWRYFKGVNEPPADWNAIAFDDANDPNWLSGPTPIGYENGSGYEDVIATDLDDMRGAYISVYARRPFHIDDPSRLTGLTLTMDWDDGYIAYINGIEADSQYPPDSPDHDQPASGSHEACSGTGTPSGPCPPDQVDLTAHIADLVPGRNVLALQVHNRARSSSDFLFIPELFAVVAPRPGDFEPDGDIDFKDYAILAAAWLTDDAHPCYNPKCDISTPPDSAINALDLQIFAQNWLTTP